MIQTTTGKLFSNTLGTLFLLLLSQTALSQNNYFPGYVITLQGDTLRGAIKYKDVEGSPKVVTLIKPDNRQKSYYPNDIRQFVVKDQIYVSAVIETEISDDHVEALTESKDLKIEKDTAFLQTIVKGPKSLYFYKNRIDKLQFYIQQDSTYELLIYKRMIRENSNIITENRSYLGQLINYFLDCPTISSKLKETRYNKESLQAVFDYYYQSMNSQTVYRHKSANISFQFGAVAGGSMTTIHFDADNVYSPFTSQHYDPSINWTGGLYGEIILPRNNKRFSIYNELTFSSFDFSSNYRSTVENKWVQTDFGLSFLKMVHELRYKIPVRQFSMFVTAGVMEGKVFANSNKVIESYEYTNVVRQSEALWPSAVQNIDFGFLAGVGIKRDKWSLECRYEKGRRIFSDHSITSTQIFVALLGFRF